MKTENKGKKKGLRFYVDGRPSTITSILLEGKSTSINIVFPAILTKRFVFGF